MASIMVSELTVASASVNPRSVNEPWTAVRSEDVGVFSDARVVFGIVAGCEDIGGRRVGLGQNIDEFEVGKDVSVEIELYVGIDGVEAKADVGIESI